MYFISSPFFLPSPQLICHRATESLLIILPHGSAIAWWQEFTRRIVNLRFLFWREISFLSHVNVSLPVQSLFVPLCKIFNTPLRSGKNTYNCELVVFLVGFFLSTNSALFFRRCLNIRLRVSPWCGLKAKSVVNHGTGIPLCRRRWWTLRKSRGCLFDSICYCVWKAKGSSEGHPPATKGTGGEFGCVKNWMEK